ncbi:hypothetical protein HF086_002116 [Spodoptera exigua]|nr:hypothetical protein HF086_002116 [Spodoptera exigua]
MTESPGGSARVALASPEGGADARSCSATPHASPDGKQPFVCTALLIRNPPALSSLYLFPPVASEQSPLS